MKNLKRSLLIAFLISTSFLTNAQDDGDLKFVCENFFNNKPLKNTKIKIVSGSKLISEFDTKESNDFKTVLAFGSDYEIYFTNPLCQTMFLKIYAANVPEDKRFYKMTYSIDIPFFDKNSSVIDTSQFSRPFHVILFDGKSRFVDDIAYKNNFIKSVNQPIKVIDKVQAKPKDTIIPILTTLKLKEFIQLAGKLSLDNDKQTPLKNKTLSLLNNKGEIIATSQTTNSGKFVFQGVDSYQAAAISVMLNSTENPNNHKIKLQNSSLEKIAISGASGNLYTFSNNAENNILNKLKDNEFNYNISGKLIATKGTEKKIASNKTVYLLNGKNEIVKKIKTNILGNFLFSEIVPGENYSIAFDEADVEPNYTFNIFSVKDKFIKKLDSVAQNKFIYKFIAVANTDFNDLVTDDSEIKMNVKGRLCGDNKNNPLSNIKVLLLNDKYLTIDSATTNKEGDFSFKHAPYTKQFLITIDDEKNILEAFSNILLFSNDENLIKMVSHVKGQKFNYKPLLTEKSKFSDIDIDDPWLALLNRENNVKSKSGKNEIITENILFEFNKAELQPQSQLTLDKVVLAMLTNNSFIIELSAHSDSKGADAYNLKLSQQRADASKLYIVNKGINATRIIAKGYGESKLINNCGNDSICSDDEHAENRRLEFKLIFN
jgi:outer membrane protein OmpA-like peptidoglycan-associated protein